MRKNYFMFIKISEERFIDSLQKEGHIYCNTIKYFRTIDDNGIKGDKNEGKAFLKQVNNVTLSLNGSPFAFAPKGQFYLDHPEDQGNIFCLYGVETSLVDLSKISLQKVHIEKSSKDFGNYALLIFKPDEFLDRVKTRLIELERSYNFSPVHYFDPNTYEGELSPFYKSNKYKYQNEVRFWIPDKSDVPFEFKIGDITDISHKIKVEDLDKIEVDVQISNSL